MHILAHDQHASVSNLQEATQLTSSPSEIVASASAVRQSTEEPSTSRAQASRPLRHAGGVPRFCGLLPCVSGRRDDFPYISTKEIISPKNNKASATMLRDIARAVAEENVFLQREGIFRVSASERILRAHKNNLDDFVKSIKTHVYERPFVVSSMVKDLLEKSLTTEDVLKIDHLRTQVEPRSIFPKSLLEQLPEPLKDTIKLCVVVTQHAHSNKMTAANLGVVFGSRLISNSCEIHTRMALMPLMNGFFEDLITSAQAQGFK